MATLKLFSSDNVTFFFLLLKKTCIFSIFKISCWPQAKIYPVVNVLPLPLPRNNCFRAWSAVPKVNMIQRDPRWRKRKVVRVCRFLWLEVAVFAKSSNSVRFESSLIHHSPFWSTMKLSPRVLPGALHTQNRGACDWWVALVHFRLLCTI